MATRTSDLTAAARIRNAALEGFARDGIRATSIRDVARAAGVSAGLVQHHFKTKDELRSAVNQYVVDIAVEAFSDLPVEGSAEVIQQEMGDRVTAFVRDRPTALRYVARSVAEGDEAAIAIFDSFVAIARGQWQRLADEGALRLGIDLTWTALHVVVLNLGTVLFTQAIDRHLPEPFSSPPGLERWNAASNALFRRGAYLQSRSPSRG